VFVLTVDQVDSRHHQDRVAPMLEHGRARWGEALLLGPDRTAGDEFQALFDSASPALTVALDLLRTGDWTVGLGVGPVALPLPPTTREATGSALIAARTAVTSAKRAPHRFAVAAEAAQDRADGLGALIDLVLEVRSRRSAEGWEVADLLADGLSQAQIATRLDISPQAVSLRVKASGARLEQRATPVLVDLLARLEQDVAARL
jgi:hypothetical protein